MIITGQEKPSLDDLAHFGVAGMKWGVRQGKSVTGVGRFTSAKVQANNRAIRGRIQRRDSVLGNVPGYKSRQNKQIVNLEESTRRLNLGKAKARDILDIYSGVHLSDLLFTKTPKN